MSDPPPADGALTPIDRPAVLAVAAALLARAGIATPPTPVATLLAASGLETDQFAFTDPYSERGLPVPLQQARADLRPLVRGMVDVAGRVVYTHRMLHPAQRRFVAFHELGHYLLPWHHSLLQCCSESDLSPAARQAWEREANLFAGACLFQGARFAQDAARPRFGWPAVRALAQRYEASLEAAARQFVQARGEPAALLVAGLRPEVAGSQLATSGEPLLAVRYAVASPAWWARHGRATLPAPGTLLPWSHPATPVLLAARRAVLSTALDGLLGTAPALPLRAELLCNGYDVLVLAVPAPGWGQDSKGAGYDRGSGEGRRVGGPPKGGG
ncbi:MAG TPA: ImmA/IrrE family metallo-endopeptidase [Chloroflexia bacterium]|nr:ImmA/IrrE family metallo-endopeptidase [Chloroflexia bacterium]